MSEQDSKAEALKVICEARTKIGGDFFAGLVDEQLKRVHEAGKAQGQAERLIGKLSTLENENEGYLRGKAEGRSEMKHEAIEAVELYDGGNDHFSPAFHDGLTSAAKVIAALQTKPQGET